MHKEILTQEQIDLLPVVRLFKRDYYLAGGTAIALYIGHRRSVDFDMFTEKDVKRQQIKRIFDRQGVNIDGILYEAFDQLHLSVGGVKITFFQYPHAVARSRNFENFASVPSLLDLAAMKAHALGGRAKWKDYVDLYFLLKYSFDLADISNRAKAIFGSYFNAKLFREQLAYFEDIDYRESIDYIGKEIDDETIKGFLTHTATSRF